jgi:integrase
MVTVGKGQNGRPVCRLLKPEAYFSTYNEAYLALSEYNKNPYDLDESIRVDELYLRWTEVYFAKLTSASSKRTVESAWKYCEPVYQMRVKDIRARHIKGIIENIISPNTQSRVKSLFNLMLDYALEYELVDKNYARTFNIDPVTIADIKKHKKEHIAFTEEELSKLWENITVPYVDVVLIQCYMGWRPQELGLIEVSNVNITNWTIRGGMKTEAGTNRIVPVHTILRDLVESKYNEAKRLGHKYLISPDGELFTYDRYRHKFDSVMKGLGIEGHRAHDPRKTFVTLCKKYNVDEYAIKRMVGHNVSDITEAVYTDRDDGWLMEEVTKIKKP